ncbi:hypothetical protein MKX03_002734 [Papaver bracteatum]|nr:hypothetical protein MKX03_002734 [Papaver bracteatum]
MEEDTLVEQPLLFSRKKFTPKVSKKPPVIENPQPNEPLEKPTQVQHHCIPRILAIQDVLGLAQTGSGKTTAFALSILSCVADNPYGVFALVITPTRELAYQLAEQFRALGASLHLRSQALMQRPHVVIATPGRIKVLLEQNPDIPSVFSKTKFLDLDEADSVLDVGFEEQLCAIFQYLPKDRQTLLFSATMTENLQTLLETVESLKQQYVFVPKNVKDVYLLHVLSKMEEMGVRSAIIFVSTCRLSPLHRFKSGQTPILLATDVASWGLDIPTVDLVINYDIPRYARDYVHRVGLTARTGSGGLAVSFVTQNDVDLIHEIESVVGKQLDKFECKENDVLADNTKVYKAKRVATMKMMDDGFDQKAKERKSQKLETLSEKDC